MAFQLFRETLDGNQIEINMLSEENETIARVCIGHDDVTGAVYSALSSLQKSLSKPGYSELMFNIVEALPDQPPTFYNDGNSTKRFLVGEHRTAALSCICISARVVVELVQPSLVCMMTVTPYLPNKALSKYGHVCKALKGVGYRGARVDPYLGSQMWILERLT